MRIGVMLRHYDQHGGGVRVYTRALIERWVAEPGGHEYVLFYNNPALLGTYRAPHVEEVCVTARSVLLWDQLELPRALRRRGIDVLFNPKYSLPLSGAYPAAWVCHGLDWYVMPWASRFIDRMSHRFLVPRYAARASAVIAVSEITREHVIEFLKMSPESVHTVYTAIEDVFREPLELETLHRVRERYDLPQRYVLYAGAVYPPKNFTRMVQAYAQVGPARGVSLVIAGGENRFLSEHELEEPARLGLDPWVKWAGWIDAPTLAAFYQMSQALLLPSLFESFGLPIIEAMASGCPVVTSNCYGAKEIAAGAALLVEPQSVDSIAAGIARVLDEQPLRTQLIALGRVRSSEFTWQRCAVETRAVLEQIAASAPARGAA
ncbi:MAG TPA: glycosyltransferase family 1 protein [Steroidobacteraceae bacterium]|nr:glycosyltransferase family 1 protein [Steroidobacteraceae bacterium]